MFMGSPLPLFGQCCTKLVDVTGDYRVLWRHQRSCLALVRGYACCQYFGLCASLIQHCHASHKDHTQVVYQDYCLPPFILHDVKRWYFFGNAHFL